MYNGNLLFMESDFLRGVARDSGTDGGLILCWRRIPISTFGKATRNRSELYLLDNLYPWHNFGKLENFLNKL